MACLYGKPSYQSFLLLKFFRPLNDYIERVDFCFDGVGASWPDDCEEDSCGDEDLVSIGFETGTEDDETVIRVFDVEYW